MHQPIDDSNPMIIEEWRVSNRFPSYEVSSFGEIRRIKTKKILKKMKDTNGRFRLTLYENREKFPMYIHYEVADVFLGKRPENMVINHKDGNKLNNGYLNLEYVTHSQNQLHAIAIQLKIPRQGEQHASSKITNAQASSIKKLLDSGMGPAKISKDYGISIHIVYDIARDKTWNHIK